MPTSGEHYYPDLADPSLESALCLVHSRFSKNTFPTWERAHPYRYVATTAKSTPARQHHWMHARQSAVRVRFVRR